MDNAGHPRHYPDELLRAVDSLGLALVVYHIEHEATTRWYASEAAARLHGWTVAELMATPLIECVVPEDRERVGRMIQEGAMGLTQAGILEMVIPHKSGHRVPVEVSFVVERRANDALVFTFMRDVSAERKSQLRFIETDRRQLIAHLASGLAHEVFNPLTYVQLNIGRIQRAIASGDAVNLVQVNELLAQIDHGLSRVINTVQKVGELTGIYPTVSPTCCLVRVVETAVALLQPSILARASVHCQVLEGPREVYGDASTVGQAVFNALMFAASGADNAAGEDALRRIDLRMYLDGDYLYLVVSDNGPHLTDNELVRIFQPFMPTKRSADNTGLAVARGLLEPIGGYVYATSTPPQGFESKLAFRVATASPPAVLIS